MTTITRLPRGPALSILVPTGPRSVHGAGLATAGVLGGALGFALPAMPADAELALLLRCMGVIKVAMALGLAGLVHWRLGSPLAPGLRAAAVGASWAATLSGLAILQLVALVPAALAFHAALVTAISVACLDRGRGAPETLRRR